MKKLMIVLAVAAAIEFVLLTVGSSWPSGYFPYLAPAVMVGITVAVVWGLVVTVCLVRKRPIPWRLALLTPAIGLLSIPAALAALPIRFRANQDSFNAYVESLELEPDSGYGYPDHPEYIGGYEILDVETLGGTVRIHFADTGFIDSGGMGFAPNDEFPDEFGTPTRRISGNWWSFWIPF